MVANLTNERPQWTVTSDLTSKNQVVLLRLYFSSPYSRSSFVDLKPELSALTLNSQESKKRSKISKENINCLFVFTANSLEDDSANYGVFDLFSTLSTNLIILMGSCLASVLLLFMLLVGTLFFIRKKRRRRSLKYITEEIAVSTTHVTGNKSK